MEHGLKLEDLANLLTPYPTQSNVLRQAARAAANPRLTPGLKPWFARWLGYQRGK
jgi:hypothetical protein